MTVTLISHVEGHTQGHLATNIIETVYKKLKAQNKIGNQELRTANKLRQ